VIRSVGTWIAFVLSLIAVLAVAVAVQAFAELWSVRFDLTASGDLSLSASTEKVLSEVQKPLEITYYYESGKRQKGADLLQLFAEHSPQIRYELLDLDRNPMRARDDGVRNYGRAVLRYDGRTLVAPASSEHGLATAIRRLLRQRERIVYFLTGHGERTLAVGLRDQFGEAARVLRDAGYDLRTLPLLQADAVPEDAAAVVIAAPEVDYAERELAALDEYVQRGGGILVLVDPVTLPALQGWIARHGLALDDDVVIDGSNRAFGTDGTNVIVPYWRNHAATEGLDKPAVLGRARSVGLAGGRSEDDPSGKAAIVARSDARSFRAVDASRTKAGRVEFDASRDQSGPVGVMGVTLVGGRDGEEGRIAVVGDADFASDNFLRLHGNQALLLRALGWLARGESQEEAPSLEAADTAPLSALYVSEDQAQRIFAIAVVLEPLLLLAIGVCVAVVRRRRR
jgi:hypothetical protein